LGRPITLLDPLHDCSDDADQQGAGINGEGDDDSVELARGMVRLTFMLTTEDVHEVLLECYDPELPVNVFDLGLIYDVALDGNTVNIKMTLTSPGCSMGAMIATEIEDKLLGLPDCERAVVEIVWEPPWTPHRMSEAARKQLGLDD
jgi:metal-sulfur cluster biosynthetic enzyme